MIENNVVSFPKPINIGKRQINNYTFDVSIENSGNWTTIIYWLRILPIQFDFNAGYYLALEKDAKIVAKEFANKENRLIMKLEFDCSMDIA